MPDIIFASAGDNLQQILDQAPAHSVIHLAPGIYRAKLMIRTAGLTIVGAGQDQTVIIYDDYARKPHPIGYEYNTFRTYTVAVCADGVVMEDLSIVNDALQPEVKGQEVALSVCGTDFLMRRCRLSSTQDTLFAGPLPSDLIGRYEGFLDDGLRRGIRMKQRFEDCLIEGTVDFIFGCGEAVFDRCRIHSVCDARSVGYVAAPSHEQRQTEGFLFRHCDLTCEAGVTSGSIFLARPWRDYGMCRFESCTYGDHIAPEGFDPWSGTRRDLTARFHEAPPVEGRVAWVNRT